MMMRLATFALAGAFLATAQPAAAQSTQAVQLSQQDRAVVSQVEDYLDGISTLQARFNQVNPDGGVSRGDFYLERPGHMRLEYDREPYVYMADGVWLTFYDAELDSRSDVPLGDTIADFIVREDVSFDGDVTLTGLRYNDSQVEVDLVQSDDPTAGIITLVLSRGPLQLESWTVVDAQNQVTRVVLSELEFDIDLPFSLFQPPTNW
ncbi:MAG: outer membrane lipoprotein carrier protein LolA [Azospirillaceae bacterium]